MNDDDAFWALHGTLDRQGPGLAADVEWAAGIAGVSRDARICDAGSGTGADLATLLSLAPEGRVTAVEAHADFAEAIVSRGLDRVDVLQHDMAELSGPFDFIWAAGSLYFLGVTEGLRLWRDALAPGGAVAFSEICWLVPDPPDDLRRFWRQYPALSDVAGVEARIRDAGWETVATRTLDDAAWEAFYGPLEARIAELRRHDSSPVWDEAETEIALWRRHRGALGYLLSVVRPA